MVGAPVELGTSDAVRVSRLRAAAAIYLGVLRSLGLGVAFRFLGFCFIGVNGIVLSTALFAAGTEWLRLPYAVAGCLALQCGTLFSYAMLEAWVFANRAYARAPFARICSFFLTTNAAVALGAPLLFLLSALGLEYLLANLLSVGTVTVLRFAVAEAWIWGATGTGAARAEHAASRFSNRIRISRPATNADFTEIAS